MIGENFQKKQVVPTIELYDYDSDSSQLTIEKVVDLSMSVGTLKEN